MPSRTSVGLASARRCRGVLRLAENHAEALAIGSDPWDFAVSTEVLRISGGLTHADLHWLVREGLVEHAVETTAARRRKRVFRHGGRLRLAGRVCFAISETGLAMARRLCAQATRAEEKPEWNETEGELRFMNRNVLYVERGDVERAIVQRFHDLDWPSLIDDAATLSAGDHAHRRTNAVSRLNTRQVPLQLRFFSVAGFDKIGWFRVAPVEAPEGQRRRGPKNKRPPA
ncbi:MAG TPA: hypothetical protein VND64_09990 [Pirellulales bacterium]|nr:hypothetical protein [Pirellulales bacterium]